MAGGEGTRLRPLTSLRPKPMVPIVNQPVMEHILGLCKHHGIDEIVATLAFMPQVIEDYFGTGEEWALEMAYAHEETPLGTAGSVKNAQSLIGDETFLVISGDALTDIDLTEAVRFHREKGGVATIVLKSVPDPLEFGVVITGDDGKVERFLEKPSWGQVFSDTINTGIYVLEAEVFDHIPTDEPYDFSSQLFPDLMAKGFDLYGYVAEGYWCDVGSLESYSEVHRDILDGNAMIYVPGVQARDGLWVADGAQVDPSATIGTKVVIGPNCTLRADAIVGDYTVLGDNCVIGVGAEVSHSVLWNDTFLGKQSSVHGAVLCRRVDVRARAAVDVGAVIGDESMIGQGARVGAGVQVYPYKRVEPAAVVNESLIWESTGMRSLFGDNGISGLIGVDMTPEMALKAAQAYGSLLPKGSHVIVSRDSSTSARMVKRAMVAGLNSAGCNVRDLRVASSAINRFTTRDTRCVGGLHIAQSVSDPQVLEIHFFDKTGLDIASWEERKIERLFFRGEFRRAFLGEVGDIIYPPRALEYYAAGLDYALQQRHYSDARLKVVADLGNGVASIVLPQLAASWGVDLVTLNPFLDAERTADVVWKSADPSSIQHVMELMGADFGAFIDPTGERLHLVTPGGTLLEGDMILHAMVAMWCATDVTGLPIAVPLTASEAVERIAGATGHEVRRPGRLRRSLASLALARDIGFAGSTSGGFIFMDFLASYDAVMALGSIARMLATMGTGLDDVVRALPDFYTREVSVFCPIHRKGAVMRAITEFTAELDIDTTEGVRVRFADGWVLVLPHSSDAVVNIWAEASSDRAVDDRMAEWRTLVESAIEAD